MGSVCSKLTCEATIIILYYEKKKKKKTQSMLDEALLSVVVAHLSATFMTGCGSLSSWPHGGSQKHI